MIFKQKQLTGCYSIKLIVIVIDECLCCIFLAHSFGCKYNIFFSKKYSSSIKKKKNIY